VFHVYAVYVCVDYHAISGYVFDFRFERFFEVSCHEGVTEC
jgi:hypothetical protein